MTVALFTLFFLPFLPPFASPTAILDPISRIFPFSCGLFEDKVANFWCFSNVVLKSRNFASSGTLVKLSTVLTAAWFVPVVVGLLRTGFSLRIQQDPTTLAAPATSTEKEVPIVVETSPPSPPKEKELKETMAEGDKGSGKGVSTAERDPLSPSYSFRRSLLRFPPNSNLDIRNSSPH
jgi:hypothetical protein